MRKILTFLLILSGLTANAQWCGNLFTFDTGDTTYPMHVFIDTTNLNNIWQIGTPVKTVFDSSYSHHAAIVTDTANSFPANDTSSFIIRKSKLSGEFLYDLSFQYQLDIDAGDSGLLEISIDIGNTWTYLSCGDLTTATNGWQQYHCSWMTINPDSLDVLFRFSFISDSTPSTKDGWMIDDICLTFFWESSVKNVANNDLITISPNPSDGHIKIQSKNQQQNAAIQVYNLNGQKVFETNSIQSSGSLYLDLPIGMYILKYSTENDVAVQRLVIQH